MKMKTGLKWSLAGAALLLAVPLAWVAWIGQDGYKQWLQQAVEARSGRSLRVQGELYLALADGLRVYAEAVRYANAPSSPLEWTLEVERVGFSISPWALLRGKLRLVEVELATPRLRVQQNKSRASSLPPPPTPRPFPKWLEIPSAQIVGGEITALTLDRRWDIRIHRARATNDAPNQPIALTGRGEIEQIPITATATVGSLQTLFSFQPSNLSLEASVGAADNRVRATGAAEDLLRWRGLDLQLDFEVAQLPTLSALVAADLPEFNNLHGRARFYQPQKFYTMQLQAIELQADGMGLGGAHLQGALSAGGAIPGLYQFQDVHLNFSADGEIYPQLFRLPPLRASLQGKVVGAWHELDVIVARAHIQNQAISLRTAGKITRLKDRWRDSLPLSASLRLNDADTSQWRNLPSEARAQRNQRAAATATAELVRTPQAWHLRNIKLRLQHAGLSLQANGAMDHLGEALRADMQVRMKLAAAAAQPWRAAMQADSARALVEDLLPLQASATLQSSAFAQWNLRDFKIESLASGMDMVVRGQVNQFAPLQFHLRGSSQRFNVANLALPWGGALPAGEVDFSVQVAAKNGAFSLENLSLENLSVTIDSPAVKLNLHGAIESLSPLQSSHLELEFAANTVADLGLLSTAWFHPDRAIAGNIRLRTAAHRIHSTARLQIGASDVRGSVQWNRPHDRQARAQVQAELVADNVELHELLAPRAGKPRVFSPKPLRTDWLHQFNGRIDLRADRMTTKRLSLRAVEAQLVAHEGVLQQAVTARMGQGDLTMNITVDAGAQPPSAEFSLRGEQLDTAGLVKFRHDNHLHGGAVAAQVDFSTHGLSMAEFAANANGRATLRLEQARMKNQTLNVVGGDIFSNLRTVLNPSTSLGEYINIECALAQLEVAQGVAAIRDGLVIKTDRVTLFGVGDINFGDETLRILLLPKARQGFGINSASLAQIVRIGGTLSEPETEIDPRGVLQSGVSLWATVSSGGLFLLAQGLRNRYQANSDMCNSTADRDRNQVPPAAPANPPEAPFTGRK